MKKTMTVHCADETIRFARSFAKKLKPGSVLALTGNLGAGKTTFVKGVAGGLGLKNPDDVKSPTFTLLHVYQAAVPVYHFDLYRLEKIEDLEAIGFEEFVNDSRAVTCIEWAEKAGALLPVHTISVYLEIAGEFRRITTA
jgi:tRNA threonylcarbamoyladenosine biosynthesis protein TsaE